MREESRRVLLGHEVKVAVWLVAVYYVGMWTTMVSTCADV